MLYGQEIDFFDALRVSATGFVVVIAELAVLAVLVFLLSKIVRSAVRISEKKKAVAAGPEVAAAQPEPLAAPPVNALPPNRSNGELELINTDEATAAVIMAIVSDKADIPLNRLNFIRIEQLEEDRP
jgi:Na+-transporting methylmalonyl-CoA/oxaloacetate decarboxylase gamma subunit